MATRWRIRHKLLLGLGLVMLFVTLLLLGTLRGLWSHRVLANRTRFQFEEQLAAGKLKKAIDDLVDPEHAPAVIASLPQLDAEVAQVLEALQAYETRLTATQDNWADPLGGSFESGQVTQVRSALVEFRAAVPRCREVAGVSNRPGELTAGRAELTALGKTLARHADDLAEHIQEMLIHRLSVEARQQNQLTLWIILPTSVIGLGLMVGLMWSFYGWVFNPIHDLSQGVARVRAGNISHRIALQSGDEMEELGAAFNAMLDQLEGYTKDLEGQVNERSRQLVRSERLASVGFLAAGVAHEINNPLASIAFCAEALEARLEELPRALRNPARAAEEQATFLKYLKMVQNEAFRCKSITERLLEFSRTGEPRREMTELRGLVQSVLDVTQHLPNHKGKQIVFEVAPGRIAAPVHAEEIKSVVLNLVINALESMDDGGRLIIRLVQKDGHAELRFADTGCGMTRDVLDNIFEPFFTRSRTGKGTGLGLTISHLIVNQHGGGIDARSDGPGMGSTFVVRLPVQPREAAAEAPAARAA